MARPSVMPLLPHLATGPALACHQHRTILGYFFTYLFNARGPTSAPSTSPAASPATPSAALVLGGFSFGSGMNAVTFPSLALPIRMPRFHSFRVGATDPDSESAT